MMPEIKDIEQQKNTSVYIVIPVHNRKNLTLTCLNQLRKNNDLNQYSILVIDDGSTDGTAKAIKEQFPEVIILYGDGNLWWTGAIKMGMEYAYNNGAEYFIWLNDDCIISENTIQQLISFIQNHPRTVIGHQGHKQDGQICFGGKTKSIFGYQFLNLPQGELQQCDLLSGNLVCLSRQLVSTIGYPDEQKTPHYGGDSLYLIRARKSGFHPYIMNHTKVLDISHHPEHETRWLYQKGEALKVLKLTGKKQTILSWYIWLILNLEDYYILGVFTFLLNYFFKTFIPILIITILRFLPVEHRKKISDLKNKIKKISDDKKSG